MDILKNSKNNQSEIVREAKKRYGQSYDYTFLEMDEIQRNFYLQMKAREGRKKRRR